MVIIRHKPVERAAKRATHWGIMWTRWGPRIYRKGDWIIQAPTGCKWPMSDEMLRKNYDFSLTDY